MAFVGCIFLGVSCSPDLGNRIAQPPPRPIVPSLLLVPGQLPLPQSIKSVQLYRKGYPTSPAVIRLDSDDKLLLEFDELSTVSGQFTVRFSHHNRDWTPSSLPDIWLFDGVNELTINGGEMNRFSRPGYHRYTLEFPNRYLKFKTSGNYLMHVFDFQSGMELFSLPFFVTENEGDFIPRVETVFNSGNYGEAEDQLFGEFHYPDFVEFPQFDLSYVLIQNRFLGAPKFPKQVNFVNDGITTFRLTRDQLFPSYFDFNLLDLSHLSLQNPQIYDYQPGYTPERIFLKPDYFNFSTIANNGQQNGLGFPKTDRDARYVEVHFEFEDGGSLSRDAEIYLIGDFNQWTASPQYKLRYNAEHSRFETQALIKQGSYSYKYITLENGRINTLYLSESIAEQPQEYMGFIYYSDPQYQFDRLLNVKVFRSN